MQCVRRGNHRSNSGLNRTSARRGVWCFRSASQMVEEERIKVLEASPWSDVPPCRVEEDNRISIMRKRLYWGMLVLSIQSVWLNSKKEKKSLYGKKKKQMYMRNCKTKFNSYSLCISFILFWNKIIGNSLCIFFKTKYFFSKVCCKWIYLIQFLLINCPHFVNQLPLNLSVICVYQPTLSGATLLTVWWMNGSIVAKTQLQH